MAQQERDGIELHDDEGGSLNAIWSRSGKRLIITVSRRDTMAQVELRPEQAQALRDFLP